MKASELSHYEFCPRLPSLIRIIEPNQFPIREAVKRHFERGVGLLYSGFQDPWIAVPAEFLIEAADRGYVYPEGNPYAIAQDHGCWLESVLRLLPDIHLEPLPPVSVDGNDVEISGYKRGFEAHLFRVVDSFDDKVRWPELLLIGQYETVTIHQLRLPRLSSGRLLSPAAMAYAHPMTGQLRLARLEGEGKAFNPSWKRLGRWEMSDITWEDWAEGISRDKCLGQIYQSHEAGAEFSQDDLDGVRRDAAMMFRYMDRQQPRQRETCGTCMYHGYCHGGEVERRRYMPIEGVQSLSHAETFNLVSSR
jgi:hypothetical protein